MKGMSTTRLQEPNENRSLERPPIMMIFHPGKGMLFDEIRKQIKQLDPDGVFTEVYLGSKKEHATLVFPLGVFSGRKRIEDGLAVLKNMLRYVV